MKEESNVDVGQTLPEKTGQQEQVIVVNHDHITRLVDVHDRIGECSVHLVVLCPGLLRSTTVSRLILLVVEQREKLVLRKATPLLLVAEVSNALAVYLVGKPDGLNTATVVVLELLF